jgi:hypothetical protein
MQLGLAVALHEAEEKPIEEFIVWLTLGEIGVAARPF